MQQKFSSSNTRSKVSLAPADERDDFLSILFLIILCYFLLFVTSISFLTLEKSADYKFF